MGSCKTNILQMFTANTEIRLNFLFQHKKQTTAPIPHWQEPSGSSFWVLLPPTHTKAAEDNEESLTSIMSLTSFINRTCRKPQVSSEMNYIQCWMLAWDLWSPWVVRREALYLILNQHLINVMLQMRNQGRHQLRHYYLWKRRGLESFATQECLFVC